MLDVGGQDATEAFEDVGHSDEAREILEGLLVGKLKRQVRIFYTPPISPACWRCAAAPFALPNTRRPSQRFPPEPTSGSAHAPQQLPPHFLRRVEFRMS